MLEMVVEYRKPTYQQVMSYYLRSDVLNYFWRLAQSRQLKFFYYCPTNPQSKENRAHPLAIDIHCPTSVDELRQRIIDVTATVPKYDYEFYPFWGIQSSTVNKPGQPDQIIGWDMRFEFDFDLQGSFDALIPLAAIMRAYDVPIVLKYSGHRSLHLIIPAESFPQHMKEEASHEEWMEAMDALGELFSRLVPYMTITHANLAKEMILTAPYSMHRYFGLVSLPVAFDQLFDFDPKQAELEQVDDTLAIHNWPPMREGHDMGKLLALADNLDENILQEIAQKAFHGDEWMTFIRSTTPQHMQDDVLLMVLMAGSLAINQLQWNAVEKLHSKPWFSQSRLIMALQAMDHPLVKTHKFSGLVHTDLGWHLSLPQYTKEREIRANLLQHWMTAGCEGAVRHLMNIALDRKIASPVLLATRLTAIIPESVDTMINCLHQLWDDHQDDDPRVLIFLALALAERSSYEPEVLELLSRGDATDHYREMISREEDWQAEARPDLALAVLAMIFGDAKIGSWLAKPQDESTEVIVTNVFSGKPGKFIHSAKRLGLGHI